jgi:alcohol oxidase
LTKNNIQQFVDLPGVGEHYMGSFSKFRMLFAGLLIENSLTANLDHNLVGAPFLASEDAVTMDEVFWGTEEEIKRM